MCGSWKTATCRHLTISNTTWENAKKFGSYRFQTMIYSSKSVIDLVVEMYDYHHCDPISKCLSICSTTLHTTWGPCRMNTTIGVLEPTTILASHLLPPNWMLLQEHCPRRLQHSLLQPLRTTRHCDVITQFKRHCEAGTNS